MMLYLLDTDHVSLAQRGHPGIVTRIASTPPEQLVVSIVTVHEQLQGRLAQVQHAGDMTSLILAYKRLHETLDFYLAVSVVDFDERSAALWDNLRQRQVRIGALDLRIAAIALSIGATLVTRNRQDFQRVPGLMIEDWSAAV